MPFVIFTGLCSVSRSLTWFYYAFVAHVATLAHYLCVGMLYQLIRLKTNPTETRLGDEGLLKCIFLMHPWLFCKLHLTDLDIYLLQMQILL